MENIVEKIKKFVEEECQKPTSKYGYEPFLYHFTKVNEYAKILAQRLNADVEVIEIASWMHDIGSIIFGRENHHITGAEIAEKKLNELGYDKNKIELVKKCILNHRGSINNNRTTTEEQIIADADALSHFNNISGLFMAAMIYENKNQEDAQKDVVRKLEKSYKKLSLTESKNLIKPKYEAAKLLLGELK